MNKIIRLAMVLTIGLTSCNIAQKKTSKLEIAKQYYNALDNGANVSMVNVVGDSIVIRESEDNYEERFSKEGYSQWLAWDSVFEPTYEILEIKQEKEMVKAKISKTDTRIAFLHEEPMVWYETIRFDKHKIVQVERTKYEVFDVPKFLEKRDELLSWVKENHIELDGFINDLTPKGGMMYLEAIQLFEKENGIDKTVQTLWDSFTDAHPEFKKAKLPESWYFHNNKKDANRLADLTLNGEKKATTSGLYDWYEEAKADLPSVGTKHIITNFDGKARAIIEITKVDTIPFNKISKAYAAMDMGTKVNPLEKWRKAHWDFFKGVMKENGTAPKEDMLIVFEQFETIWPKNN